MSLSPDLLRPSRAGDQFHYWWAARRCLELLRSGTDMTAIAIEGVPPDEEATLSSGVEVIDVAEYHGATDLASASRVRYVQLKHSTRAADVNWTPSGLAGTLVRFASRYDALAGAYGDADVAQRFLFEFVTNRPISPAVIAALDLLRAGIESVRTRTLARAIGLSGHRLFAFCRVLRLTGGVEDYLTQRRLLQREQSTYLPGQDAEAPLELKELVTRRATSEFEGRPQIVDLDVLKALGTDKRALFPAPPLIERPEKIIERAQLRDIAAAIGSHAGPTIVHADGGVGKSVIATRLAVHLPAATQTFVYDCFGNGAYRNVTGYRHRPQDGLVQLTNELATAGLCDPMIPSSRADAGAYVRAFVSRLEQASAKLAGYDSASLLCLVIDAADNAQDVAIEVHDGPSFPKLLLREVMPANVRLVLTARSHRVERLDPPLTTQRIELLPFDEAETGALLRSVYPDASQTVVREFHRLTSRNPRVQAAALAGGGSLSVIMARLGPEPRSVQDTIQHLLEGAVARARDAALLDERRKIDLVCEALATLRPFVPIAIVARTADVPEALVRSLAADLQHPLLLNDDAVQFRDEPTETWFRERFRPRPDKLAQFLTRLAPLASDSFYVAAGLPQLMLEAGQFDALVQMALRGDTLPGGDDIARRDIELQRLRFALKAAVRAHRYPEAARLALKAGNEAAADERQQRMLAANTDLTARFLDPRVLLEKVSRREIRGGGWTGSDHIYEAAALSATAALQGEASSKLRLGYAWLKLWARNRRSGEDRGQRVEKADIAEMAMAELNLNGAAACAQSLRRWTLRETSFEAGLLLGARLVDSCHFDEIDALAIAAGNDLGLLLALTAELDRVGRLPPAEAVARATKLVLRPTLTVRKCKDWKGEPERMAALTSLAIAAARSGAGDRLALGRMLGRYLAQDRRVFTTGPGAGRHDDRDITLRAYAIRQTLLGRPLGLNGCLYLGSRSRHVRGRSRDEYETRKLREQLGELLPWLQLSAEIELGLIDEPVIATRLVDAEAAARRVAGNGYGERSLTADAIAGMWAAALVRLADKTAATARLKAWIDSLNAPMFIPTSVEMARRFARADGLHAVALTLASGAFVTGTVEREHAESIADTCISIARAVLPIGHAEAEAYFGEAIRAAANIGDENVMRWEAILHLADAANVGRADDPETAYRMTRAAEVTYDLVARAKHFPFDHTMRAITGMSPRSALAILSRWTDRRFGSDAQYLALVCDHLHDLGLLDPGDALALLPFRVAWDHVALLERVFAHYPDRTIRVRALEAAVDYYRFLSLSAVGWLQLAHFAAAVGLDLPEVAEQIGRADGREATRGDAQRSASWRGARRAKAGPSGAAVFRGLNPAVAEDLRAALARHKALPPPRSMEDFFAAAWRQLPPGSEPAFLDAIASTSTPTSFELRQVLHTLPDGIAARPAVRDALARLVRATARNDVRAAMIGAHWHPLDWGQIEQLSGIGLNDAIHETVTAFGLSAVSPDAAELFNLAGQLSRLMAPDDALITVRYGLDLYEPLLRADDGDGAWSQALMPPPSVTQSLAGYIWAALADPDAARRWQAAHVVRIACRLDRSALLAEVTAIAQSGRESAFADAHRHFYRFNALLWLMIALASAAQRDGAAVAPHGEFLRNWARADENHVLIRAFAARALLMLDETALVPLGALERARLRTLDRSERFGLVPSLKTMRRGLRREPLDADDRERFLFGIDFDKYWISPAADRLGMADLQLELMIEQVIRQDWGLGFTGRWTEDVRGVRRQFDERRAHQGALPDQDHLSFYLAYHGLMVAVGKRLRSAEITTEPPDHWRGSYADWLDEHRLTRSDGLWLADRRDPTPLDVAAMPKPPRIWIGSVRDTDLARQFQPAPGWISVAAYWTRYAGTQSETVTVNSALASADKARALLRALQSAGQYDQWLPDFGDSGEIDRRGYALKGWVFDPSGDRRLDEKDEWAADTRASPYQPADPFRLMLDLSAIDGDRFWRGRDPAIQIRSEIWSEGEETEDMRYGGGRRLLASPSAIAQLLAQTGMSLIARVRIERGRYYRRYDRRDDDGEKDDSQRTRFFLLEQGGRLWTP